MVEGVFFNESACLLGENCKYNGTNNYNNKVIEFIRGHEVIAVCPEVLGGLKIPRKPAEIVDGMILAEDGINVDKEFQEGAAFSGRLIEGQGIFAEMLKAALIFWALLVFTKDSRKREEI